MQLQEYRQKSKSSDLTLVPKLLLIIPYIFISGPPSVGVCQIRFAFICHLQRSLTEMLKPSVLQQHVVHGGREQNKAWIQAPSLKAKPCLSQMSALQTNVQRGGVNTTVCVKYDKCSHISVGELTKWMSETELTSSWSRGVLEKENIRSFFSTLCYAKYCLQETVIQHTALLMAIDYFEYSSYIYAISIQCYMCS